MLLAIMTESYAMLPEVEDASSSWRCTRGSSIVGRSNRARARKMCSEYCALRRLESGPLISLVAWKSSRRAIEHPTRPAQMRNSLSASTWRVSIAACSCRQMSA